MKLLPPIALAIIVFIQGCGGSNSEEYDSKLIYNFVASCSQQGQASVEQCGCMMDEIRKNVSQDKFMEYETNMLSGGKIPDEFNKIISSARSVCR
ncbi:hypothetical protein HH1059_13830 [Halorhodospira halochloris]|uniref:Lipoprotein n=2 Tax=Halorhodospira halochloris TaxID=1052 RepID=A0A2Z6EZL9_HALHR|nr:hypothetical protein [Halorhodospira halochloris]MBK1653002.1 hypothetical protein [Halorhodospira halochloris]BBE11066.1 hypothetical protein HH1059_13830 [Halorhodospira halochloris]